MSNAWSLVVFIFKAQRVVYIFSFILCSRSQLVTKWCLLGVLSRGMFAFSLIVSALALGRRSGAHLLPRTHFKMLFFPLGLWLSLAGSQTGLCFWEMHSFLPELVLPMKHPSQPWRRDLRVLAVVVFEKAEQENFWILWVPLSLPSSLPCEPGPQEMAHRLDSLYFRPDDPRATGSQCVCGVSLYQLFLIHSFCAQPATTKGYYGKHKRGVDKKLNMPIKIPSRNQKKPFSDSECPGRTGTPASTAQAERHILSSQSIGARLELRYWPPGLREVWHWVIWHSQLPRIGSSITAYEYS